MSDLKTKRHSGAHILAMAVREIFPEARFGTGPVTEDGFYYDVKTDRPITEDDLKKLEKLSRKLIARKIDFVREEWPLAKARAFFREQNQPYKLEIIDRLERQGRNTVSVYRSGDFTDLCEGPHVANTAEIDPAALRITRLAGAYWNNDQNNDQLTRVYGLLFENREQLRRHLAQIEEAKKRDHRKLGKDLRLFAFSDHIGAGLPLFTPRGTIVREAIAARIETLQKPFGWQKVTTPHLTKRQLYEISGHWQKFADELFKIRGRGRAEFALKPMNCPHHSQIFAAFPKSYKDLPVRYAENGVVYRDEQAGELLGLTRTRHITQDDGHAFVTPEQISEEVRSIISVIKKFYTELEMLREGAYRVSLSLHDPAAPEKYMLEEDGLFLRAEKILEEIAREENLPYEKMPGEAAFYGPKLDFQFRDALGREWQLATIQLDFSMPKRFGLEYTDRDGRKKTPIMIHRAVAGSLERFTALMIEHTDGYLPFWMAPEQVRVLPVADNHRSRAEEIVEKLRALDIRVELDASDESFGRRVRAAKEARLPYFIVIGDRDLAEEKLTLQTGRGRDCAQITLDELLEKMRRLKEL